MRSTCQWITFDLLDDFDSFKEISRKILPFMQKIPAKQNEEKKTPAEKKIA